VVLLEEGGGGLIHSRVWSSYTVAVRYDTQGQRKGRRKKRERKKKEIQPPRGTRNIYQLTSEDSKREREKEREKRIITPLW
jgi:hypothetical protein